MDGDTERTFATQVPATPLGVSTLPEVCVSHPVGSKPVGSQFQSPTTIQGSLGEGQEFPEHGQAPHVLAKRPRDHSSRRLLDLVDIVEVVCDLSVATVVGDYSVRWIAELSEAGGQRQPLEVGR